MRYARQAARRFAVPTDQEGVDSDPTIAAGRSNSPLATERAAKAQTEQAPRHG